MLWLLSCALISEGERENRMDGDADGWDVPQDCDGTDAEVHPSGTEVCNGIDDDCDGSVDEGAGGSVWYIDADGDGYGDAEDTVEACVAPEGYVDNDLDCFDGDAEVFPGGEEVCGDGIDNNCDPTDSESCRLQGDLLADEADAALFGDAEGAGVGWEIHTVPGLGPQDNALLIGAPAWDEFRGSVYLINEPQEGAQLVENQTAQIRGEDAALLGYAIDHVPPQDGSGEELILGAPGTDLESGRVYRVHTPVVGELKVSSLENYIYGSAKGATLGTAITSSGDLSGDGDADIVLGAPGASGVFGGTDPGRVSVHSAAFTGVVRNGDAEGLVTSTQVSDLFGFSVAAADVDGDGLDDLLVGAPWDSSERLLGGSVSVYLGPVGVADNVDHDYIIHADWPGDNVGTDIDASGDLNFDGYADVLVGAAGSSLGDERAGAAALFLGPPLGDSAELSDAHVVVVGQDGSAGAGCAQCVGGSVASVGDMDDDGFGDVLIGAALYAYTGPQGSDASAALVYGRAELTGLIDYSDSDLIIEGSRGSSLGGRVASAGDANQDGIWDIAVGAASESPFGVDGAGAVFLFWGSAP